MPFAAVPARSTAILRSSNAARQIWASHNRGRAVCSSGGASSSMEPDVLAAVQAIHSSPTKAVFAVTGGGAQARRTLLVLAHVRQSTHRDLPVCWTLSWWCHQGVSWLLSVPGASGTVLEAVVPYSRRALADFLGREPVKFVSEDTARDLALHAYRRAVRQPQKAREGRRTLAPDSCHSCTPVAPVAG